MKGHGRSKLSPYKQPPTQLLHVQIPSASRSSCTNGQESGPTSARTQPSNAPGEQSSARTGLSIEQTAPSSAHSAHTIDTTGPSREVHGPSQGVHGPFREVHGPFREVHGPSKESLDGVERVPSEIRRVGSKASGRVGSKENKRVRANENICIGTGEMPVREKSEVLERLHAKVVLGGRRERMRKSAAFEFGLMRSKTDVHAPKEPSATSALSIVDEPVHTAQTPVEPAVPGIMFMFLFISIWDLV